MAQDLSRLSAWIVKAEAKLGVTRTGANNYEVFEAGAKKLGYKEAHTGRIAINSGDYDHRPACQQTGFFFLGCKFGAKWS